MRPDHPLVTITLLAVLFGVVRCTAGCAPMPEPVPWPGDAGTCEAEQGHDACGIAARHVWCELQCEAFRGSSGIDRVWGTADDDSFAEACRAISFNTTCLASAETCEQAEQCE